MRSRRLPLLLASLFALAAGALGLYLLLFAGPARPPQAASAVPGPRGAPAERGAEHDLRSDDEAAARAARSNVEEPGAAPAGFALEAARWIQVQVVLPAGTPADEQLRLRAVSPAGDVDAWLRAAAPPGRAASSVPLDDTSVTVACERVGPTTFRAPFAPDASRGALLLEAHYAYLDTPRVVDLEREQVVRLEPRIGGRLLVHLQPPLGASAEELARVSIQAYGWSLTGESHAERLVLGPGTSVADFGGLPGGLTYIVHARPDPFAEARVTGLDVVPGQALEAELELRFGARLAGHVRDADGAAVGGAEVTAEEGGSSSRGQRSAETDADGRFELDFLAPGKVELSAQAEGFARGESLELELSAGRELAGLELVLPRGNSVRGRLSWPDGRPAAGAVVELRARIERRAGGREWTSDQRRQATTDDDGRFSLAGLEGGPFRVSAAVARAAGPTSAAGESAGVALHHAETWHARAVDVQPGEDVALVLQPPIQVRGRVVDDRGVPLARFSVRASQAGDLRPVPWQVSSGVDAEPGELFETQDGTFLLASLGPGRWTLRVGAAGHGPSEPLEIELPGDVGPHTFTLPRVASVAGRVLDPQGLPASGASVVLRPGGARYAREVSPETVETDEQGSFLFEDLDPAVVELAATRDGAAPSETLTLDLAAAAVEQGLILSLRVGGRLTGEIFRPDGRPDAGRQITIGQRLGAGEERTVTSDAAGRFELAQLAPGSVQVVAMPDLTRLGEGDVDQVEAVASLRMTSAEIVEGRTTHVVLGAPPAAPVALSGVVREAGRPAPDLMVVAVAEGSALLSSMSAARTARDGTFALELPAPGDWLLLVGEEDESSPAEFPLDVPAGERHHVELSIPGGRLAGIVRGADGAPRGGVPVVLAAEGTFSLMSLGGGREVKSDTDGRFEFRRLRADTYTLRAAPRGDFPFGRDAPEVATAVVSGLAVPEDGALDGVEIRLSAPGTIRGLVRGPDGAPAAGAFVFVRDAAGQVLNPHSWCASDGKGRFEFRGAGDGRYTLSARSAAAASRESAPVDLAAGGEVELELDLVPGTSLVVRLEDQDGAAVRAAVSVRDTAGRLVSGLLGSDAQERLLVDGFSTREQRVGPLAPGRYEVRAVAPDSSSASTTIDLAGGGDRVVPLRLED